MDYILYNKEHKVCRFQFSKHNFIEKIVDIYNIQYAPLDIVRNGKISKEDFQKWYLNRGISVDREDYADILNRFDCDTKLDLIKKNLALSLSDQYWIQPENLHIQWKDVNLFQNDYDSLEFAEISFGPETPSTLDIEKRKVRNHYSPNPTTNGMLKKLWIKKDDISYLIKGANSIHKLEPIHEVIASHVCDVIEADHVPYHIKKMEGKRAKGLVSLCPCMIHSDEEMISAFSILKYYKDNELLDERDMALCENILKGLHKEQYKDYYELYVRIVENEGIAEADIELQKMFLLDYIMLNEDRHLNNFGIIRNVETLKWEKICPIYDTGRSFETNINPIYWNFKENDVKCFTMDYIQSDCLLDIIHLKLTSKQIENLKDIAEEYRNLLIQYKEYIHINDIKINELYEGFKERIDYLKNKFHEKNLIQYEKLDKQILKNERQSDGQNPKKQSHKDKVR